MTGPRISRRGLGGAALAGATAPYLAACGTEGATPPSTDLSAEGGSAPGGGSGEGTGPLVETGDVPVGGGVVVQDAEVVVTQPTEGQFNGFTAICTHQGCLVSSVEDDAIVCACHRSRFSVRDGSVLSGPATAPLAEVPVTVRDGDVVRG